MTDNTTHPTAAPAAEALASAMLETSGRLMLMVDHMLEYARQGKSAPDADPVDVVLRRLISGTLASLDESHDLAAAAATLEAANTAVGDEIFLVNPDADDLDPEEFQPR